MRRRVNGESILAVAVGVYVAEKLNPAKRKAQAVAYAFIFPRIMRN